MSNSGSSPLQGTEIAIVGMAGRFPGARTLEDFWHNLEQGVESIQRLCDDDLRAAGVPESDIANPQYVKAAAILDHVEDWDASFWGFTPHEASLMDPQHRLFLECAWESLEDAGHAPEQFPGAIGVFAGCGMQAYMAYNLLPNRALMERDGLFLVRHTGNDKDFLATRVSYQLDLRGPSINVQTACSTSLVAVHLAIQSLLSGECDMALAGGVTIELPHGRGYVFQENEILSPDGHCRPFDADSQGTVFGSGAGVLVLRRLEDALRDGDRVQAVVRGSAINNDGSNKVGYLAPSVDGQAAAVAEALAIAGVSPGDISVVETHGTGTPVGDPIEIAALTSAFRTGTDRVGYCGIGSLKSNIGHLDTAAGAASLIKTVLAMQHRVIPASLHYHAPNPAIPFATSPFYVNATTREWASDSVRRAGVSSLGVGGTNAHVILEEAPERSPSGPSRPWQLFVLSASGESALDTMTANLTDHFDAHGDINAADAAYTLTVGRQALTARRAVVAQTVTDARDRFDTNSGVIGGMVDDNASVTFMFSGGGAQYAGMGSELYATEPVYRSAIEQCLENLEPTLQDAVRRVVLATPEVDGHPPTDLEQPSLALPALFATQVALARLLESWGIVPQAMIGHSMGEYTAAHLAGVFSLRDAMRLVTLRGQLFETVAPGAMLSVPLSETELRAILAGPEGHGLSIAAINAPELAVVSGPVAGIDQLAQTLMDRGVESRRLHIAVAAHSAMLDPILDRFGALFDTVSMQPPNRQFISNETGTWITAEQATDAQYWVRHLRHTVRFADGIATLAKDPSRILLEVGPGRVLATLARQHPARDAHQLVTNCLRSPVETDSDAATLLAAVGQLWSKGIAPDWRRFWEGQQRQRLRLPSYAWERQRYWIDAPQPSTAGIDEIENTRRHDVATWGSRVQWVHTEIPRAASPVTLTPGTESAVNARVLLYRDTAGLADALHAEFTGRGYECITVSSGAAFAHSGNDFTVVAGADADHDRMVRAILQNGAFPSTVVFTWGVTADDVNDSALTHTLEHGYLTLAALAKAISSAEVDAPVVLNVVTSHLHALGSAHHGEPAKALLLGPTRVIPRELPNIQSRAIDIVLPSHRGTRQRLAQTLVHEFSGAVTHETIAYRDGERFVQQFAPTALDAPNPVLRTGGVYVITGGLGGIGYALAEHLAQSYAAKLVLLSRSATGQRAQAHVNTLTQRGAQVVVLQADVTDIAQVRAAFDKAEQTFGAIHGVFHAAGVLDDQLIVNKTRAGIEQVLAPKVQGTLCLDEAIGDRDLDCFVLFSSVSAEAGLPGQADYAAANAFLNAFAHTRSARTGQPTLAIGWGAWRDVGMTAALATPEHERRGVGLVLHPVLGTRRAASDSGEVFSSPLSAPTHWVLADHRLRDGEALLPGTAFLEVARAAVAARPEARAIIMRDVAFLSPCVMAGDATRELRTALSAERDGLSDLAIAGAVLTETGETDWQIHATARVGYHDAPKADPIHLETVTARCSQTVEHHNGVVSHPHLAFGPRWQNVFDVCFGNAEAIARLELPQAYHGELEEYALHPALMDMATAFACALAPDFDAQRDFFVPLSYTRLVQHAPLTPVIYSHVRYTPGAFDPRELLVFDVTITDATGRVLVDVTEFMMTRVADAAVLSTTGGRKAPKRSNARFDIPETAPAERRPRQDLSDAIATHEGMAVLELLVRQVTASHLLATPFDPRVHIPALRAAAAPPSHAHTSDTRKAPALPTHEVEAVLSAHPVVHGAAVVQRFNRPGDLKLVAYVVFHDGEHATVSDIRRFLKARLPENLVPSTVVEVDTLPRFSNGAVDRESLPDPFGTADDYVAPRTETERQLADIWKDVLGVARVSVHDNFFDVGGHSLLSVRVVSRVDKLMGVRLNQANMVLQTLEQLAAEIERQGAGSAAGTDASPDPATSNLGIGQKLLNALRSR